MSRWYWQSSWKRYVVVLMWAKYGDSSVKERGKILALHSVRCRCWTGRNILSRESCKCKQTQKMPNYWLSSDWFKLPFVCGQKSPKSLECRYYNAMFVLGPHLCQSNQHFTDIPNILPTWVRRGKQLHWACPWTCTKTNRYGFKAQSPKQLIIAQSIINA